MIDRATVKPPNPESKIPIGALLVMTGQAYGEAAEEVGHDYLPFEQATRWVASLP